MALGRDSVNLRPARGILSQVPSELTEPERGELELLRMRNAALEREVTSLRGNGDRAEASKLKQQMRTLEIALSHTPDMSYIFDPQGRFTYVNRSLLVLWNKSLEEVIGKTVVDLEYPEELAATIQGQIRQVIETRRPVRHETEYAGADGSVGFYEYILVPVMDRDGVAEAVAGSTRDITERKRSEAALRESEDRFSAAFSHAPVGMVITAPDGLFIEANQAYLDMLGLTREEIAARPSDSFTHPDDVAATHQFGEGFRTGAHHTAVLEKRYYRKNGDMIWARASGTMRRDHANRPTQFIAVIEDITRRKQIEDELQQSQERLQQVFAQSPVAICLMRGRELMVELANPYFQQLFAGRVLLGQPILEALPELKTGIVDILLRVLDTGVPYAANEFLIPLDRDEDGIVEDNWFNFVYQPLRELDGSVSAVVVVAVDVSPHVRARQALERANRELEEFAYVASHDLQEPLRMVNIYTQLLTNELEAHLTGESRGFADQVQGGVKRMEQLLKDLLKFSHILHSGIEAATEPGAADLNIALSRALGVLQNRIEEEGATVVAEALPAVRGEEAQLMQVLQNLVGNALKYRRPDAPALIEITSREDGEDWVVSVRDNGIGFDQNQAERVFGLFKRLHQDEYPGTGLGLAICKRVVERYGGRIWAESSPGQGSTFSFALPRVTESVAGEP